MSSAVIKARSTWMSFRCGIIGPHGVPAFEPRKRRAENRRSCRLAGSSAPAAGGRPGGSPRELALVRTALLRLDRIRVAEFLISFLLDGDYEELGGCSYELGLVSRSGEPLVSERGQLELVEELLARRPGQISSRQFEDRM
jgi:hypothetical protein